MLPNRYPINKTFFLFVAELFCRAVFHVFFLRRIAIFVLVSTVVKIDVAASQKRFRKFRYFYLFCDVDKNVIDKRESRLSFEWNRLNSNRQSFVLMAGTFTSRNTMHYFMVLIYSARWIRTLGDCRETQNSKLNRKCVHRVVLCVCIDSKLFASSGCTRD